jgi:Fe-S cluster assembly ATP-binding protein
MLEIKKLNVNNVLKDISLSFEVGKTYVIMGSNGVGKSTLLHAIMGRPDIEVSGEVILNNEIISDKEVHERAQAGLFLGFQTPTPIPGLSNFQMLKQALDLSGADIVTKLKEFKELSAELALPDLWDRKSINTDASGGEKKKNELIQMNMLDVSVAMLDEPDSGLDVDGIDSLIESLNKWKSSDRTLIVVTHYEKLIAGINPDTVVVLQPTGTITGGIEIADKIFQSGFKSV